MKTCTRCECLRPLEAFAFKSKAKGTRVACCKDCQRKLSQAHYRANKAAYIDRAAVARETRRLHLRSIKESQPCADCDLYYPSRVMDFHHPEDQTKEGEVNTLVNFSEARMLAEIAKCVLLCANCHRLRHH